MSRRDRLGFNSSVMSNGDFYSVETYSGYGALRADPEGKHFILDKECSDEELGKSVLDAMSVSRIVDPDDEDNWSFFDRDQMAERYKQWIADLMSKLNYKTKRALFKKMHNCSVCRNHGVITVVPSLHDRLEGWSGNGITTADNVVIPDSSTPAEVGAAVRLAFTRCKSRL